MPDVTQPLSFATVLQPLRNERRDVSSDQHHRPDRKREVSVAVPTRGCGGDNGDDVGGVGGWTAAKLVAGVDDPVLAKPQDPAQLSPPQHLLQQPAAGAARAAGAALPAPERGARAADRQ